MENEKTNNNMKKKEEQHYPSSLQWIIKCIYKKKKMQNRIAEELGHYLCKFMYLKFYIGKEGYT